MLRVGVPWLHFGNIGACMLMDVGRGRLGAGCHLHRAGFVTLELNRISSVVWQAYAETASEAASMQWVRLSTGQVKVSCSICCEA